ncbi:MAG: hypothetical protein R6X27_14900 [Candidatus Desulfacyla sp.]
MTVRIDMEAMNDRILALKRIATELQQMADDFPAVARNTARILSSAKMLEINLSDLATIDTDP